METIGRGRKNDAVFIDQAKTRRRQRDERHGNAFGRPSPMNRLGHTRATAASFTQSTCEAPRACRQRHQIDAASGIVLKSRFQRGRWTRVSAPESPVWMFRPSGPFKAKRGSQNQKLFHAVKSIKPRAEHRGRPQYAQQRFLFAIQADGVRFLRELVDRSEASLPESMGGSMPSS